MKLKVGDVINQFGSYAFEVAVVESATESINAEKYELRTWRSDGFSFTISIGFHRVHSTWMAAHGSILGGKYWNPVKGSPRVIPGHPMKPVGINIFINEDPDSD